MSDSNTQGEEPVGTQMTYDMAAHTGISQSPGLERVETQSVSIPRDLHVPPPMGERFASESLSVAPQPSQTMTPEPDLFGRQESSVRVSQLFAPARRVPRSVRFRPDLTNVEASMQREDAFNSSQFHDSLDELVNAPRDPNRFRLDPLPSAPAQSQPGDRREREESVAAPVAQPLMGRWPGKGSGLRRAPGGGKGETPHEARILRMQIRIARSAEELVGMARRLWWTRWLFTNLALPTVGQRRGQGFLSIDVDEPDPEEMLENFIDIIDQYQERVERLFGEYLSQTSMP
ncbi:MAG TPA: hypothetical protein VJ553_05520, partial [Candidatus Paceibacterota bacterium]|nr:hypothetical protein [Candidatus Paceibacterota bacterium]